jgi:mono/diheme cytochrome c family protein
MIRVMRKTKWFYLILIVGISISCSKSTTGSLYTPTSADVTATATLEELQQGRTLYINHCGACHNLYSPDDYSVSGWKSVMSNMAPKTSMNASQVTLVTKYVTRGQ